MLDLAQGREDTSLNRVKIIICLVDVSSVQNLFLKFLSFCQFQWQLKSDLRHQDFNKWKRVPGKLHLLKKKKENLSAIEILFYFLYRCQILSRHPIYYSVNLLIRVDTNRAEICLTYYSQGFFFHTLARSQTFLKVKGKKGEAVGVKFPAFYQQDEYDPLPS